MKRQGDFLYFFSFAVFLQLGEQFVFFCLNKQQRNKERKRDRCIQVQDMVDVLVKHTDERYQSNQLNCLKRNEKTIKTF